MGIEGGGVGIGGGIGGGGGMGAGFGGGIGVGGGLGGGIEAGGSIGVASFSGPEISIGVPAVASLEASFGPVMGLADISPIVNECPFMGSITDFDPIRPATPNLVGRSLPLEQFNVNVDVVSEAEVVADRAWDSFAVPDVITEAEEIFFQAQKPSVQQPMLAEVEQWVEPKNNVIWISPYIEEQRKVEPAVLPQVEPIIAPFVTPNIVEFPKPEVVVSPAIGPAVQAGPQTGSGVANETEPAATPQPVLQEVEEEVSERVAAEQIDTVEEEETEESRLKNVVDEEVLNTRIQEFGIAVDIVGAEAEEGSEEIDGGKIVKLVPAETEDRRSGLVKKQGPDGSRVEPIEEIAFRKFGSVKEAKENIMAIIARKVPVKRAKEGIVVGYEAVVRVLKYFFGRLKPEASTTTLSPDFNKSQRILS